MTLDPWATPAATQPGWGMSTSPTRTVTPASTQPRLRRDLRVFATTVAWMVLLGAPAGLLWSVVAPRYTVEFKGGNETDPYLESTKAFIGADGSYFLVVLGMGLLSGAVAWWLARRSGPWTVAALAVGGALAALVAQRVGLMPRSQAAFDAYDAARGKVELFLGRADRHRHLSLRAAWGAVAWPVGALVTFLVLALGRPEDLD